MICQLATCDVFHNLKPIASRKSKKKKRTDKGGVLFLRFVMRLILPNHKTYDLEKFRRTF